MRPHRHQLLPDVALQPQNPVPSISIESQEAKMKELRAAHNKAALGYRERDDLMTAWVLSNTLSRQDMARATGLAKSRVDQIVRETYLAERRHRQRRVLP
jgi:hypothetical protein